MCYVQNRTLVQPFEEKGLMEHPPRSPDLNVPDISIWTDIVRAIWSQPYDEQPKDAFELTMHVYKVDIFQVRFRRCPMTSSPYPVHVNRKIGHVTQKSY